MNFSNPKLFNVDDLVNCIKENWPVEHCANTYALGEWIDEQHGQGTAGPNIWGSWSDSDPVIFDENGNEIGLLVTVKDYYRNKWDDKDVDEFEDIGQVNVKLPVNENGEIDSEKLRRAFYPSKDDDGAEYDIYLKGEGDGQVTLLLKEIKYG
jgi:hypothetical protein